MGKVPRAERGESMEGRLTKSHMQVLVALVAVAAIYLATLAAPAGASTT
jgi:hypothetical protein